MVDANRDVATNAAAPMQAAAQKWHTPWWQQIWKLQWQGGGYQGGAGGGEGDDEKPNPFNGQFAWRKRWGRKKKDCPAFQRTDEYKKMREKWDAQKKKRVTSMGDPC